MENQAKPKKTLKRVLITVTILLIVGVLVYFNFSTIMSFFGIGNIGALSSTLSDSRKYEMLTMKESIYDDFSADLTFGDANSINVLVFGLDENEARESQYTTFRPDTIIVATINLADSSIKLVSVPRDSYVPINGRGKDKINSAFAYAAQYSDSEDPEVLFAEGVKYLSNTVSDLLGIHINYYAGVDMDGVVDIVNTLGGVTVDVHEDIYVKGKLRINAGEQVLSGKDFLTYARNREYSTGDIGRVEVQQRLFKALFKEATKASAITKLPKLVSQAFAMVRTDVTFEQATALAFTLVNFSTDNIKTATVPGDFGNLGSLSYWIINQSKLRSFAQEYYGVSLPTRTQDPTSDACKKLSVTLSSTTTTIGGTISVTEMSGDHADGKTRSHKLSECNVSISDSSVLAVSGNGFTGLAAGTANVTISLGSGKQSFTITVQ